MHSRNEKNLAIILITFSTNHSSKRNKEFLSNNTLVRKKIQIHNKKLKFASKNPIFGQNFLLNFDFP